MSFSSIVVPFLDTEVMPIAERECDIWRGALTDTYPKTQLRLQHTPHDLQHTPHDRSHLLTIDLPYDLRMHMHVSNHVKIDLTLRGTPLVSIVVINISFPSWVAHNSSKPRVLTLIRSLLYCRLSHLLELLCFGSILRSTK